MTAFRRAIHYAIAQYQFHYRDEPWCGQAEIGQINTYLQQMDVTNQTLYDVIGTILPSFSKKSRLLQTLVTNVLEVYAHSIYADDSISKVILNTDSFIDHEKILLSLPSGILRA